MNTEIINETINVCKYVGQTRKASTIEGEVVLQDIKPDILSIVKCNRDICITKKVVEDDRIRIDGCIDIGVIYIADDETNSVRGVNTQIDFSESIELNGITENSIIKLKYDVGNVEYKVINGRKISVRCSIIYNVKAFENSDVSIIKGMSSDEMQMQKMNQILCGPISRNSSEVLINENIKLGEANPPIGEILCSNICILDKDYKISYNKILAKAEVKIKIVYIADNERQSVETFEATVPVMGFVDVDGVNDNSDISIEYGVKNFGVRPVYQDLQSNTFSVDACIEIVTFSCEKNNVELITDFYIPTASINTETKNINVLNNLIDLEEYIELSQTLVVPELDFTNILNIDGIVELNEKNVLNGKVAVAGNIDINVLFSKRDSHVVENKRIELPFQQVIKVEGLTGEMNPMLHIEIEDISYSVNGENQINVKIRLLAEVVGDAEVQINSTTKVDIIEENLLNIPSIIVYYVKPGDTLWNIAKRFRNTIEYIKEMNDLSDDMIYPGQRLLIPRLQINNTVNSLM